MVLGSAAVQIVIRARDEFSRVFKRASLSLAGFQKAALGAAAVGVGISLGFKKAIQTSIEFESAFTGVRKTVELTEAGFEDLENRFKELTKTTPITFQALSAIGEIAGQLGVEGVENLEKFTKVIADISVTTNLTAENAATSFARIANVMQEPLDNIDRMGSVVVELGNNFATTEAEIVQFAQRIAGAGKIVGLTTADVFAISAALSSVGVQAEAGGSATQRALLEMNKAVINGKQSFEEFAATSDLVDDELSEAFNLSRNNLNVFAKTAGLTSDKFVKLWKTDAARAFEKFIIGLGKSGDDAQGILEAVELDGIRTTRAFLSLANAGDLITRVLDDGNKEWEVNNALTEEANKRYKDIAQQIKLAKNKFALLAEEIGNRMVPFFKGKLIPALDKIIVLWDAMSPRMQNSILIFAGVAAAVTLVAGAIALVTLVSSPWLLVIIGIIAAITLLIVFFKELVNFAQKGIIAIVFGFETLRDTVTVVASIIQNAMIIVMTSIVNMVKVSINFIIDGINLIIKAMNKVGRTSINFVDPFEIKGLPSDIIDIDALRLELAEKRIARGKELVDRAGVTVFNIENLTGLDSEDISRALADELNNKTSL